VVAGAVGVAAVCVSRVGTAILRRRLGRSLRLVLGERLDRLGTLGRVRVLLAVVALGDGLVVRDVARGAADLSFFLVFLTFFSEVRIFRVLFCALSRSLKKTHKRNKRKASSLHCHFARKKETRERLLRSAHAPSFPLEGGGGTHEQKKTTHQRLLELRVGVLVRLDVLALALLVVVVLVLLRAHLAPGEVVDKVHARVVGGQRPQLEKVAPVAVEAVLAVDELRVGHVDRGVALEEVGDGVLVAESRVVGVLLLMFF